jgi:hypothetical protein
VRTVLSRETTAVLNILFPAKTVAERVNDLSEDTECEREEKFKHLMEFSTVVDIRDVKDIAHCAVPTRIRVVNGDLQLLHEVLEVVYIKAE